MYGGSNDFVSFESVLMAWKGICTGIDKTLAVKINVCHNFLKL